MLQELSCLFLFFQLSFGLSVLPWIVAWICCGGRWESAGSTEKGGVVEGVQWGGHLQRILGSGYWPVLGCFWD